MPEELRVDWAAAQAEVLALVRTARQAGDGLLLERALKWDLCLHDVLLRGPCRGTRGGGRQLDLVASRFELWRKGERCHLVRRRSEPV